MTIQKGNLFSIIGFLFTFPQRPLIHTPSYIQSASQGPSYKPHDVSITINNFSLYSRRIFVTLYNMYITWKDTKNELWMKHSPFRQTSFSDLFYSPQATPKRSDHSKERHVWAIENAILFPVCLNTDNTECLAGHFHTPSRSWEETPNRDWKG